MLEFQNVSYQYPSEDFDIIDHLSFAVEPGSFHCIIGISGCGKSTIFRMTNGLLKPKAGTILVEGKSIVGRKLRLYAPEGPAVPLANRGRKCGAALGDPGGADPCGAPGPGGGGAGRRGTCRLRQQDARRALWRDAAAGGLCPHHADEPFSALDFLTRISMQEWLLDQWQRHKRTILFITHDVEEALFLSSSVLVVERTPIRELAEIPVPASFPRDRSCLKLPEMVELKEHLIDLLRKQVTP